MVIRHEVAQSSILLRRNKKRGVGKGLCHDDWTNEYFAKLGLFTMTTARASAGQSPKGAHLLIEPDAEKSARPVRREGGQPENPAPLPLSCWAVLPS